MLGLGMVDIHCPNKRRTLTMKYKQSKKQNQRITQTKSFVWCIIFSNSDMMINTETRAGGKAWGRPRRAQPEEAPQPPAESEVYVRSGVSAHVTSYDLALRKPKNA